MYCYDCVFLKTVILNGDTSSLSDGESEPNVNERKNCVIYV